MMAGIALAPETPAESVFELVEAGSVDTVLLLSVRPGETDGTRGGSSTGGRGR
jgi:pentose-5-phosphate-3-epimerase